MSLALALVVLATTAWLAYDANHRDWRAHSFANRTWKWVVGSLLLWVIVFPLYLVQRRRVPLKS